jgi:hypothetical protein
MKKSSEERGVTLVGVCWLIAGIMSVALGLYQGSHTVCNCPETPNVACNCQPNGTSFLYVGVVAVCAGVGILLARSRIAAKIREYKSGAKKQ